MDTYIELIRSEQTAILIGRMPFKLVRASLSVALLAAIPAAIAFLGLWLGTACSLLLVFLAWLHISEGYRDRERRVIQISQRGVHSRGVFVPWSEVADIKEGYRSFFVELGVDGIAKFDDSPWEERMRLEVAKLGGLRMFTSGQSIEMHNIADLCRFARSLSQRPLPRSGQKTS